MKYIRMLLAVVGLFVAAGSIATALADDDNHHKVTLYTPPLLRGANISVMPSMSATRPSK